MAVLFLQRHVLYRICCYTVIYLTDLSVRSAISGKSQNNSQRRNLIL